MKYDEISNNKKTKLILILFLILLFIYALCNEFI